MDRNEPYRITYFFFRSAYLQRSFVTDLDDKDNFNCNNDGFDNVITDNLYCFWYYDNNSLHNKSQCRVIRARVYIGLIEDYW